MHNIDRTYMEVEWETDPFREYETAYEDEDAGEVPIIALNAGAAAMNNGMCVGEDIDRLMQTHASRERGGHGAAIRPPDEVGQQVAQACFDVGFRKIDVS